MIRSLRSKVYSLSYQFRYFSSLSFANYNIDNIYTHFQSLSLRKLQNPCKKIAAVYVPLCIINNKPSLLYTKRAKVTLRKHSGQVSFPGGLVEDIDKGDYIQTAIRETIEELGLQDKRTDNILKPISLYHETYSTSSIGVTPVIGFIENIQLHSMNPNSEVDEIFTISFEDLLDTSKQTKRHVSLPNNPNEHPSRIHLKEYTGGKYKVWGLTSYITEQVLKELQKIK